MPRKREYKFKGSGSDEELLKRRILFTPCKDKQALHDWIQLFLDIDFPMVAVDTENGSVAPMDAIWDVYNHCVKNNDYDYRRVLFMSARDSGKTLSAACLELLQVLHCRRNVVHLAAIEQQSQKSFEYLKTFLGRFIIRDYLYSAKSRLVEVLRFEHKASKENITDEDWSKLDSSKQEEYERVYNYIKLLVLTAQSTNSDHVPSMSIDECDLIEGDRVRAYEESKMILGTDQRGNLPITLIISTRKTMTGLVQKEVDKAAKSGLVIHKWNILDITEPCPPERHLPMLPKIPIWHSDILLSAVSEDEYINMSPDKQAKYVRSEGFQGCLSNCQLFSACKSRLATVERPPSSFYKQIGAVQGLFREVTPENAQSQLLCWKPSRAGLIYPRLERSVHYKSAASMASMISGQPEEAFINYSKQDLINLALSQGLQFYCGMDFGYSHNFAVVTGFRDGNRLFVLDLIAAPELELSQKLDVCNNKIKHLEPVIFADPEDPASIKTFKRYGYHMRAMKKAKGSVIGGIDAVRNKLAPLNAAPQLFFLADDEGMDLLFERLSRYHWRLDAAGEPTDTPDENQDDEVTALRYLVMSLFPPKGKPLSDSSSAFFQGKKKQTTSVQDEYAEFFQNIIEERIGNTPAPVDDEEQPVYPSWWKFT